jgi:hypothetical protein
VNAAQSRVSGGRPDGGQYTATEHSDTVVALSPAADRLASIAAIRSQQLVWQQQKEALDEQQRQLANKVGDAATASAAIELLEVLPQAATISYRRDGSEVVFMSALDADGATIVTDEDVWDWDKEWARNHPFKAALRRSEEILEASGLPVDRWVDINVDDAIRKAAARLQADAAR